MHKYVFHNDRVLPINEVRLSPGQAGLLNGWGLFTTNRIYDGLPFAFERHWKRLSTDAARINLPWKFSSDDVHGHLLAVIRANGLKEGYLRVYFIHNKIGVWHSDETMPDVDLLIMAGDIGGRVGPTSLTVQPYGRYAAHPLEGTKVISWLHNVWVVEQAHQRGFDETILLNEREEVAECTAANIFCVRGGQLYTPPLSSGCLPGVSREILLEVASKAGLPASERMLKLQELYTADEVFISSTSREVQPVSRINEHKFAPGPVTARLAKAFADYVAGYLAGKALPAAR